MVYGYIRVSTDKQTVENQRFEVSKFCHRNGISVGKWIEETISGTQETCKRKLGSLLEIMQRGDIIICSELSRLGRNLLMIMSILNACMEKDVQVWTIKDNYKLGKDISSKVLAFAFGLSAEIERTLISQRTKEALARKRAEGIRIGRPSGAKSKRCKFTGKNYLIKTMLLKKVSKAQIAKRLGVHSSTLIRFLREKANLAGKFVFSIFILDLNLGEFMNIFRLALPAALMLLFSVSVFADDDDELAPRGKTGTVTIITDPPGSFVFLDGDSLGKSPIIKRRNKSGPLKLIVIDQGKELINTRFNVWPNKENKFEGTTTMPHGTIKITTNPSSCQISLDGEYADRTIGGPLTLNSVDAGDHQIGATCPGRKVYEVLVKVEGEKTVVLFLDAVKRTHTKKVEAKQAKKSGDEDED